MPDLEAFAEDLASRLADEAMAGGEDMAEYVAKGLKKFLTDNAATAASIGVEQVKAILFGEACKLAPAAADLSEAELAELSTIQIAQRQRIRAVRATQMAIIATAEAEHQTEAAAIRASFGGFLDGILDVAGKIGANLLATSIAAL